MERDRQYAHVVRAISETPWAILPETLEAIVDVVSLRARGELLSEQEIQARIGSGPARKQSFVAGDVAVLPLYGVIFPRANLFSMMSGGTSLQEFAAEFDELVQNPRISSILIDINSPGGSTSLVTETAQRIRAARGTKPVFAQANTLIASAAMHLAAQADEIIASPSSLIGSVGVFMAHDDFTAQNEMLGIKTTMISAGRFKTEGQPLEPLTAEAKAHYQELVDDTYDTMVMDIAAGRGVTVDEVRSGYGEGRVMTAKRAVDAGLADSIATFEDTLARLRAGDAAATKTRTRSEEAPEVVAAASEHQELTEDERGALAPVTAIASDMRTDNEMAALAPLRALADITRKEPPA